jgi:DNA-binding Lrp family transcriptional regulator
MDLRDFQILVELGRGPFASFDAIGRKVGLSGPAVKLRLKRLERHRVLLGLQVLPAPQVFGRRWHVFAYLGVNAKLDLVDLLKVENVVSVWRGGHGELMVNTFDPSPTVTAPPGISRFIKQAPAQVVSLDPPATHPSQNDLLSPLDWRVMEAIIRSPRSSCAELSKASGLSPRTVRKRRDALLAKQWITVLPNMDTSREPGLIVYGGYVGVANRGVLERIEVPGLLVFRRLYEPPAAWFLGHAETLADLQTAEEALRSIPGVLRVDLGPARPGVYATKRLLGWVRAEVHRWETARKVRGSWRSERAAEGSTATDSRAKRSSARR